MGYLFIGLVALLPISLVILIFLKPRRDEQVVEQKPTRSAERFVPAHAHHYLDKVRAERTNPTPKAMKPASTDSGNSRRTRATIRDEMGRREELKGRCLAVLDSAAVEHPAGHSKLAARYVFRNLDDDRIELMFEKAGNSRANLWLAFDRIGDLSTLDVEARVYRASELYQSSEPGGKVVYGRHAALKPMRDLANVDLVRFTIDRVEQLEMILSRLGKAG